MPELTESQKRLYDSIKTNGWFSIDDIPLDTCNKMSKCQKIAEKGFFESRSSPVSKGNYFNRIMKFRKVKRGNK